MKIISTSLPGGLTYKQVLDRQLVEFNRRLECRKNGLPLPDDLIIFVEHKPVYTLGRHGKLSNLLISRSNLEERNIEFVETSRGGDITYHGPGQLTVYPIFDLQRLRLGVKDFVSLIERVVIDVLAHYHIIGETIEGKTGVWIGKDTPEERKICAIGIHCSRFVSMHGFALNVGPDISAFSGIVPCGLQKAVTSISLEAGGQIEIEEVKQLLVSSFLNQLKNR